MKKLISMRIEPGLKKFIEEYAEKDRRNFSNFMLNSTIRYIENQWGVRWEDVRLEYIEKAEQENGQE